MDSVPGNERSAASGGWSSARLVALCMGGHGRPAAVALAVVFSLAMLLGEARWQPLRHLVFDTYQRCVPRPVDVASLPAILIAIDEASVAHYGQWPWPRTRLARLIEAAHQAGALAIGLDLVMPEADRLSPGALVEDRPDVSPALREALASLPANETLLAQSLARTPVVIGRAATAEAQRASVPARDQTTLLDTPAGLALRSYAGHVANLPEIEDAAAGRGYFNSIIDDDGVVRSMPLVLAIQGHIAPSLALELLRVTHNQPAYRVQAEHGRVRGVQVGDAFLPTEPDGRVRLYFSALVPQRRISALEVLHNRAATAVLKDRIVLIGVTALGLIDVAVTPVTPRMDGAEVQIQFLENLHSGSHLLRPWWALWVELALFLTGAVTAMTLLPRSRPWLGVLLWSGGILVPGGAGLLVFAQARLLFDPAVPALGNTAITGVLLVAGLAASDRRRRELRAALEIERLERSRMAGELQAARKIQMGMLPKPGEILDLPPNITLSALLEPAREVGGDLYDAFMLDERHFFFLVGDVAGKGVPASLFMALCQTLCRSTALRATAPLDALMTAVNAEIAQHNPEALFVTAVAGILDTQTGWLELCSAGHEAPVVLRSGAKPRVLVAAGGLPLCVFEDLLYESNHVQLQEGDLLVMTTDGISEAQDAQQTLYGLDRLLVLCEALQGAHEPLSPVTVCEGLYADVQRFTQGVEPADDLTIMAIRYTAPSVAVEQEPSSLG